MMKKKLSIADTGIRSAKSKSGKKADTSSGDKKIGHKANGKVSAHQGATRQGEELAKRGL
jgi:hypothetical protein